MAPMTPHTVRPTVDGAACSCGKTWSVWTTRRGSGWSTAHDAHRTRNLLRATADRHAKAANGDIARAAAVAEG